MGEVTVRFPEQWPVVNGVGADTGHRGGVGHACLSALNLLVEWLRKARP